MIKYHQSENKKIKMRDCVEIAYREFGKKNGTPVVMFNHLAATLENWDSRLFDKIAENHRMIAFDNRGVGGSGGKVPRSIPQMATDALEFIDALGLGEIDIFAFSLGGMVVQELVEQRPKLVRKLILTGTSGRGGEGLDKVTSVTFGDMLRAGLNRIDPKRFLFFYHDEDGKKEAIKFLNSINSRKENLDEKMRVPGFINQLIAIKKWSKMPKADLSKISQSTLIANGDFDRMVPTSNSYDLNSRIKNSELIVYPKSGHGGIFQYHDEFSKKVLEFLAK